MSSKIDQLEELARIDPEDESVWFLLGQECVKAKNFERAIEAFTKATSIRPQYTAAFKQLGDASRLAGKTDQAVAAYRQGIETAAKTRDLQTAKECAVFLKKLGADVPDIENL